MSCLDPSQASVPSLGFPATNMCCVHSGGPPVAAGTRLSLLVVSGGWVVCHGLSPANAAVQSVHTPPIAPTTGPGSWLPPFCQGRCSRKLSFIPLLEPSNQSPLPRKSPGIYLASSSPFPSLQGTEACVLIAGCLLGPFSRVHPSSGCYPATPSSRAWL